MILGVGNNTGNITGAGGGESSVNHWHDDRHSKAGGADGTVGAGERVIDFTGRILTMFILKTIM